MNPVNQFLELVREEYARINDLKQAADERGEIIENLTAAYLRGEMDEQTYNDLLARVCRNEAQ